MSEYAPDLVMFNLAPPLQSKGLDEKGIEKWFSQYEGVIDCKIRDLSISTGDDLAFCHYLHRITETMADAWRGTSSKRSRPFGCENW